MNNLEILKKLNNNFKTTFGSFPERFYFSPGRINFIGEHIDYNGGRVLPFAIDKGTYAAVKREKDNELNLYSELDKKIYKINLKEDLIKYKNTNLWIRYPVGLFQYLKNEYNISGLSIYFFSDLPTGAGLSSSASIEVLTGFIILSLFKEVSNIDRVSLALLSQKVENEFVGVKCGIMDQFAVAMGKRDHLILLDTYTLEYEYIKFLFPEVNIVVINSKVSRNLSSSKYNERRNECEKILEIVDIYKKIVDIPKEVLLKKVSDPILQKRGLHIVEENQRVYQVKQLLNDLKNKNPELPTSQIALQKIGELLYQSHYSLKDLYEVSCKELDIIVEESKEIEGVVGARMTGAGFGGCAIALVKKESFEEYKNKLSRIYKQKTSLEPEIFSVEISDGVKELFL